MSARGRFSDNIQHCVFQGCVLRHFKGSGVASRQLQTQQATVPLENWPKSNILTNNDPHSGDLRSRYRNYLEGRRSTSADALEVCCYPIRIAEKTHSGVCLWLGAIRSIRAPIIGSDKGKAWKVGCYDLEGEFSPCCKAECRQLQVLF